MNIEVRAYTDNDIEAMVTIWNQVVEDGVAFPQEECLTPESGTAFFAEQTYCGVAEDMDTGRIYGMYILHPNNVGRCGHMSDCLAQGKAHGYRVLQFNAVVASNVHARHLYERLGFKQLGTIPGGFRMKDGSYEDICPYYHEL